MTQQQTVSKTQSLEPVYAPQTRLLSASFVQSVPFGDEAMSVSIGSKQVEAILVARLDADGLATAIEKGQRSDGILLRAKRHDRARNTHYMQQCFVPWSNVRGLGYGD